MMILILVMLVQWCFTIILIVHIIIVAMCMGSGILWVDSCHAITILKMVMLVNYVCNRGLGMHMMLYD